MIYVLLADGFEDIEAICPIDILRRAEIPVKTVGVSGKSVTTSHGITVLADILIDEVKREEMTMLVLPGGAGHVNLDASCEVDELIKYALDKDIYIAAICAAPSILGRRGILNGKRYTCFPGYEEYGEGGIFTGDKVVLDGKILTARGAGAASDLGFCMVEILKGKDKAEALYKEMQF